MGIYAGTSYRRSHKRSLKGAMQTMRRPKRKARPKRAIEEIVLDVADIATAAAKFSTARCGAFAQAAAVCLDHHKHVRPVQLRLTGRRSLSVRLHWPAVSDAERRSWGDLEEAVEDGAYGLAFLLLPAVTDYTVLERSSKGTGVDYYLGRHDSRSDFPFQHVARLEVSGILRGRQSDVDARVRQKRAQAAGGGDALPNVVSVTEFGSPQTVVVCS